MRHILLIAILMMVVSPVLAQSDPLYVECGAEDYLNARYYALQPLVDLTAEFNDAEYDFQKNEILGRTFLAYTEQRTFFTDYEDLPECVEPLNELSIERANLNGDRIALLFIADKTGEESFAVQAGRIEVTLEFIEEDITTELTTLGWLDEDGEFVNEPPPQESD